MVNVVKSNFLEKSQDLIDRLPSAAYAAIDLEMTGITIPGTGRPTRDDTPEERYPKLRPVPEKYSIIQAGVALFHENPEFTAWVEAASRVVVGGRREMRAAAGGVDGSDSSDDNQGQQQQQQQEEEEENRPNSSSGSTTSTSSLRRRPATATTLTTTRTQRGRWCSTRRRSNSSTRTAWTGTGGRGRGCRSLRSGGLGRCWRNSG